MRYFALATDYDGTLASQGNVDGATLQALERFVASGRRLVLVTGRQLDELEEVFPRLDLFESVVAENGAVLFSPSTRAVRPLESPPDPAWIAALRARGVAPLSVGHVIVATREPHEATVLEVIRSMGLELHVEFNKGSVMVLPAGVTKGTGLAAALLEMGLSAHNVVGVGDAENDHALLGLCEWGVSVANALPSLKERSDWVTPASHGAGVAQLIDRVLAYDMSPSAPARRHLVIGRGRDGGPVSLAPVGRSLLVTATSRSERTTVATALFERLLDAHYQLCIIDPDGHFASLPAVTVAGSAEHPPTVDEVIRALSDPRRSVVATLSSLSTDERAPWLASLLSQLLAMRARTGRPHWVVLDEADQMAPARGESPPPALPKTSIELMLITVAPANVSRAVLSEIDDVVATSPNAEASIRAFAEATGRTPPAFGEPAGTSVLWRAGDDERRAVALDVTPARPPSTSTVGPS